MLEHTETQYARSGELAIAYRTVGQGPRDILFIPGFVSNVEMMPEIPFIAHDLARMASLGRVVYFDKRGVGLSERSFGSRTAEDQLDDVLAVADASGIERATVVGLSEGGPLALLFAAAHPGRVESLVLWSTTARIRAAPDYPEGAPDELIDELLARVEERWGSGRALRFVIDLPSDDATRRAIARYERQSATPRGIAEVLRYNTSLDVRGVLESIHVPTLVVHRSGDRAMLPTWGRYLAARIDGARYIELPGDWHVSGYVGRDDDVLDTIVEFVTGTPVAGESDIDRVLSTVLFTDIVESTDLASNLGDRQWRAVLEQHDSITRRIVERSRGVFVKNTGDGALATFDGPGRAVRAALALDSAVAPLAIRLRAGVHTGEVERRGDDVAGIAVHIGARLSALAQPGEVLVSNTVKDLVLGSEIEFADRGVHVLKGVPGDWQIWSAST